MALLARLLWEAVLLFGVVVVIGVTAMDESGRHLLTDQGLGIVGRLLVVGLLATGLSLSVRAGAPNLAVGALASVGGAAYGHLVQQSDLPGIVALIVVLATAFAVGLVIAVAVAALRLPAWGVSLAVAVALSLLGGALFSSGTERVDGPDVGLWALALALLLAAGSVTVGAVMWTHAGPRVAARSWRAADPGPAGGWNVPGALLLTGATVASSVLAAAGGVMSVVNYATSNTVSSLGAEYLMWATIPVLLAGASLRSPRGAVAGIVLASALNVYLQVMLQMRDAPAWVSQVGIAVLALIGLLVGRGLDAVAERMAGAPAGTASPDTVPDATSAG